MKKKRRRKRNQERLKARFARTSRIFLLQNVLQEGEKKSLKEKMQAIQDIALLIQVQYRERDEY